jgi:hypothetical protein
MWPRGKWTLPPHRACGVNWTGFCPPTPGQLGSQECGGPLGTPWLIGGIICVVVAAALYFLFEGLLSQRA